MNRKLFLWLATGVCASFSVLGQQPAPVHSAVTYRIKPDRVGEWQDLRRQVVDIYKKAGLEYSQLVYSSSSGPFEYVVVRQYAKWADLNQTGPNPKLKDSAAQLTALNSRMMSCVESMTRDLGRLSPLSYGLTEEPAPMVRVLRTTVRPGHTTEYQNLVKAEVVPAYKKAGIKTFVQITPQFGSGRVTSVTPVTWAELDAGQGPLVKALGQDGVAALMKKLDPHVARRDVDLFQYRPGLSYRPAGAGAPSGGR